MPAASLFVFTLDGSLLVLGLFFLWRFALGARARSAPWPVALPFWNIAGYAFGLAVARVLAIGFGGQLFTAALLGRFNPDFDFKSDLGVVISGSSLHVSVLLGLGVAWYFTKQARFVAEIDRVADTTVNTPPVQPGKAAAAGLVTFAIAMAITLPLMLGWPHLLKNFGHDAGPQVLVTLLQTSDDTGLVMLIAFIAVVVAPITEELVFRAGLYRYLRGRLPSTWAILVPAALFSLLHGSLAAFPALLLLGIILALAYERTGRIAVPIIAHALFNLNTLIVVLLRVEF